MTPGILTAARKLAVKVDGKKLVVELDGEHVRVNGVLVDVEIVEAEPGVYVLRRGLEQVLARVDIEATKGSTSRIGVALRRPGLDPVVVTAEVGDAQRAAIVAPVRAAEGAATPVAIRAPIPGRVVKVLAKVGDRVNGGQTVVVLEAMKMENELRAPRAGQVLSVTAVEGTAVEAGQDLVTMM